MMVLSSAIYDVNLKNMSSVRNWLERHLIIYSRANESICPDREDFSQQKSKSSAKVLHAGSCMQGAKR